MLMPKPLPNAQKPVSPFSPLLCHHHCFTWVCPPQKVGLAITLLSPHRSPGAALPKLRFTFAQRPGLKCGAEMCGSTSRRLTAELGQDEGLYSRATLRSTVLWRGVPQRGFCSSPPTASGTWRERTRCPLPPPHGTSPRCAARAERAGGSEAGGKQPASQHGAAEESTGLHKRCLVPPRGRRAARPLPRRRWKTQLQALLCHPSPPSTSPPWVQNVLRRKKPEV